MVATIFVRRMAGTVPGGVLRLGGPTNP
jgi:hypothetical protein